MTIKTAVTLTTGAAVGFLFGLGMNEKDREKIVSWTKNKIFYALTGEEIPAKKNPFPPKSYYTKYNDYYNPDLDYYGLFEFDTEEDGADFLERAKEMARKYATVSLSDICEIRGLGELLYRNTKNCINYGWRKQDVEEWTVCKRPDSVIINRKQYWIPVSNPKKLNV